MRVGAPVFCGLEPGADAPKILLRSEVMKAPTSSGRALLLYFSNEGAGGHQGQSCLPRPVLLGKGLIALAHRSVNEGPKST
jgi:hypothetical protein